MSDLPAGWTEQALGSIADCRLGKMLDAEKNQGKLRPYLRNTNVQWGNFDLSDIKKMRIEDDERDRYAVVPGDLLVCEGGVPGRCAVWRDDSEMYIQKALHRVRPLNGTSADYLRWFLEHAMSSGVLENLYTGSTIKHLTGRQLARIIVPAPPIDEQRRIAAWLDEVDARRAAITDRLATARVIVNRLRAAVLAAACSGHMTADWRDCDDEDAARGLPHTWTAAPIGELFRIQNGRAFPSKEYERPGHIRLLRPGNLMPDGSVAWEGRDTVGLGDVWAQRYPGFVLGRGELLMNLTAQSLKDEFLGRACLKTDPQPALLNQRIARFTPHGEVDLRPYALIYFKSRPFRAFVDGLDSGTLIRHLHVKQLVNHAMPLPPPDEQMEIVRRVAVSLRAVTRLEAAIRAAETLTDRATAAAIAKVFRGELVPTDNDLSEPLG